MGKCPFIKSYLIIIISFLQLFNRVSILQTFRDIDIIAKELLAQIDRLFKDFSKLFSYFLSISSRMRKIISRLISLKKTIILALFTRDHLI